jgi:hypothetical protein
VEYVYVESNLSNNDPNFSAASLNLNRNTLISLIHGVKQNNFGFDTVKKFALKLTEYKNDLSSEIKIYVDSGGYSVIKGDVDFDNTQKLIDSYHRFLEYENNLFDYIFTLDIPLWGTDNGFDEKNTTRDNLYHFNRESLTQTLALLKNHPELLEKIHFVWQFANPTQYDVWSQIFSELEINQHIKNRAIGGLVGIRERSGQLDFSPFTTMAFKCFHDYLNSPFTQSPFRLHILGTYHRVDRLQLLLIERLFSHYCRNHGMPAPTLTYDTINYTLTAMFQMKNLQPYRFENQQLIRYKNILEVEDDLIRQIYHTQELYDAYQEGKNTFEQLDSSLRQEKPDFLVPLNVFSNLSLDGYLNYLIDEFDLFSNIIETAHRITYTKRVKSSCNALKKLPGKLLRDIDLTQLQNNFDDLYFLWDWLNNNFSDNNFMDRKIDHTIKQIGFSAW